MDTGQQTDFLHLLKTLADEHRLTMVGLMSEREYTVSEMAGILELTDPTVSHHVSKLHGAGLLNLRMAGNQRFYRINEKRIEQFKRYAAEVNQRATEPVVEVSDNAWIDALDWSDEDKKVLVNCTFNGRLTTFEMPDKKWMVVLRWLASKFQAGERYTEKQVNSILSDCHRDYALLRRELVEYGFMRRERGGGDYWLAEDDKS